MGVTGLWRLLEPAGKPVPLETLENKVLAVDISIWLHQMVKGFQDPRGGAVTNAHLLGLFQRLCKLLYYRIKPVFVFDGGVPTLKRLTITKRQSKKSQMHNTVDQMRKQLLGIVTKQMAVNKVIAEKAKSPKKKSPIKSLMAGAEDENLFKLPPMVEESTAAIDSSENDSDSEESATSSRNRIDLHSLDVNSAYFKSLTPRERHDLLTELKETRKQNSWGRIHELPAQSDNFSDYQMKRLLKRRQVQVSLEETEKEMGGHYLSLNELEILLNEEGIDTKIENITSRRIASNENSHFVLIKDVKEALESAAKRQAAEEIEKSTPSTSKEKDSTTELGEEFDEDLDAAIKLSLQCTNDSKPSLSSPENSNLIDLTFLGPDIIETDSEWSTDEESENNSNSLPNTDLSLAKAYMLENSGLSEYEIMRIINSRCQGKSNVKKKKNSRYSYLNTNTISDKSNTPEGNVKTEIDNKFSPNENCLEIGSSKNDTTHANIDFIKQETDLYISTESDQISASTVPQNIQNFSSSSDSDDNFEEVPEITTPSLLLTLKTDPIIEDDIFSDIFQNDVTKEVDQKDTVIKIEENKKPYVFIPPLVEVAEDHLTIKPPVVVDDVISESFQNEKNKMMKDSLSTIGKQDVINEKEIKAIENEYVKEKTINANEKLKQNVVINIDNSISSNIITDLERECTSDKETSSVNESKIQNTTQRDLSPSRELQTPSLLISPESSPQKGMTLNEIRHMITKDSGAIGEEGSMEKQMISTEELSLLADDLEVERDKIEKQQSKLDRMGRNISEEMTKDAQDLLKMFGIPYIVAPMEAEAQCAFLESINLTDGTITDDSDIWLFGGKSVYKNFFNQQKYVLQFLSENIQSCFKLSREQLILLALLVGSDYTTGVNGVGPVTAMEILAAFPSANADLNPPYATLLTGLRKFRSWWGNNRAFGHMSLRNKLKNISLTQEFPSHRVVEAYLAPTVDKNSEAFSWGKPDVTALREFARAKFGWSQSKTDEVLKPVLKRLDEKVCQQSIRSFFRTEIIKSSAEDNMSKRVKKAVERMGGSVVEDENGEGPSKTKKPRKQKAPTKTKVTKKLDTIENTNVIGSNEKIPYNNEKIIPSTSPPAGKPYVCKKDKISKRPFIPERYQEVIPQRESDKSKLMNTKLKAIELFRTSKKGPSSSKKRKKTNRPPKADAELSESSSD